MTPILRSVVVLHRHPCVALLAVQLAGVPLYAVLVDAQFGQIALRAFGLLVLGFTLRVVRRAPNATGWASLMAACVLLEFLISLVHPTGLGWIAATELIQALFYFYAAGALIAYVTADQVTTVDELAATGATFTVLAWAFAHLFMVLALLRPGSFSAGPGGPATLTWFEYLFLSFTSLSGVGLSDIVPLHRLARAVVMIEEFTGVMYLGMVVARVVGQSMVSHRRARRMARRAEQEAAEAQARASIAVARGDQRP